MPMGGFSKPHIDSSFKSGTSISKSAKNIKIVSTDYSPVQEAETLDLDVAIKPFSKGVETQFSDSEQLDELQQKLEENRIKVIDVSQGPRTSYDTLAPEEIEKILKNYDDAKSKKPLIVFDSYHGYENEPAGEVIDSILEKIADKTGDKANSSLEDIADNMKKKFNDKYNQEGDAWGKDKEEKFRKRVGEDHFDEEYKVGEKWKADTLDVVNKELWDKEGALYKEGFAESGKYGKISAEVSVGSYDTEATLRVGPDHIVLDASIVVDGIKIEASYDTPALATRDGLILLAAGVDGEVSVLHAEAKARAGVGVWKDEKGIVHREAGVQLKAEADLFRAGATGDVTAFGVTATGSVGVKIGIGAQLDAGLVDGELKVNLSLAVGIGLDVGFSIDFNNAIDFTKEKLLKYGKKYLGFMFG